jgi:hypothetical protein
MALEFIPARADRARPAITDELILKLRSNPKAAGLDDAVMYYGWPRYTDYEAVRHQGRPCNC